MFALAWHIFKTVGDGADGKQSLHLEIIQLISANAMINPDRFSLKAFEVTDTGKGQKMLFSLWLTFICAIW